MTTAPFASSCLFRVSVGELLLGAFTTCDGLGCTLETEDVSEAQLETSPRRLPARMTYSDITLSRPLGPESAAVWAWITNWWRLPVPVPAEIVALAPDRTPIVRWWLWDVIPVRWQGPSFNVEESSAASETLEIAHHGFLPVLL